MKVSELKLNRKIRTAIALTLTVALPFSIGINAKEDDVKKPIDEDMEVIDVVGNKPLSYYRDQMKLAESTFYDMFNALVDEEEFKIKCRNEKPTGSNIRQKVCYPQYVLTKINKLTQEALSPVAQSDRGIVYPLPTFAGAREDITNQKRNESENYIKNLLVENPDLYRSYMNLKESVENYQQKKSEDS